MTKCLYCMIQGPLFFRTETVFGIRYPGKGEGKFSIIFIPDTSDCIFLSFINVTNFTFWIRSLINLNNHLIIFSLKVIWIHHATWLSCRNAFICRTQIKAFWRKHYSPKCNLCIFCTGHEGEMLKESQLNQEYLKAELEEAKNSLQKTEV